MARKDRQTSSAYWTLSPVYYATRIFGLAPYTVGAKNNGAHWRVTNLSTLYSAFSFIFLVLCLITFIIKIEALIHVGKLSELAMYSNFFWRVGTAIISLICVTISLLNRHKTCKLMSDLNDFDLDLVCRGIKLNYEEMRRKNMILILVTCLITFPTMAVHCVVVLSEDESPIYRLCAIPQLLTCYSTVVQFIGFLLALYMRYVNN